MKKILFFAVLLVLCVTLTAHAQMAGNNTKGDMGLQSGTQPPPGFYIIPLFYDYSADTVRNRHGDKIPPLFGGRTINARAGVMGLMWVSEKKIFGGNYSVSIWPAFTNNAIEFPALEIDDRSNSKFADLYMQPISLGWHLDRADFLAGLGLYAPTGDYEFGSDTNSGLGMWSYELYGGTTLFFDDEKSWHFATFAAYETHAKKDGTDIRVGDIITLEGGLGKSFMDGALSVGAAYYAQWKISNDDFGIDLPGDPLLGKHQIYGFGPEVSIPIASKNKLFGFVNLRYFWETGARTTLEGNTFVVTFTIPVPSVSLQ